MKKRTFFISISLGAIFSLTTTAQQIDPPSMQLSAGIQRALEVDSVVDELAGIVVLCANACEPKSSSSVRRPMQELKGASNQNARPTPRHDTGMAIIRKIGALSCQGAASCVDMIARKGMCKVGTVKCNAGGCRCEGK